MSDEEEIKLSPEDLRSGVKIETGGIHVFVVRRESTGSISFVLLTEAGVAAVPGKAFTLSGHGLQLSGNTDEQGEYTHDPAEFGEYELTVGEYTYRIPAVHRGDPPHPVHARPGSRESDWEGPLESELDGFAPEDAEAAALDADDEP